MSAVGKLLIFLHLFFSVMFLGFAGAVYTAQSNWREAYDKQNGDLGAARKAVNDAAASRATAEAAFQQEVGRLNDDLTRLKGEKATLTGERDAAAAEAKQLRLSLDTEREVARLNSSEANDRKLETDLVRTKNSDLHKEQQTLVQKLRTVEDTAFSSKLKVQELENRVAALLAEKATLSAFLRSKNLPSDAQAIKGVTLPPPDVRALVLDSRKSAQGNEELVEVSLGGDDALKKGHVMTLFRKDKYLGKIRLISVDVDRSVGVVIEKSKNATIQKGDEASTQF